MAKILVVEDDPAIAQTLIDWFSSEGHVLEWAKDGEDGLQLLSAFGFDVIFLDWMLPGMSGLDVCKKFRKGGGTTKIIFLTGQGDIKNKEQGLDFGADDYVVKPFECIELSARLRSVLRRPAPPPAANIVTVGAVTLNPLSRIVSAGDNSAHLMPKECALLEYFMKHPAKGFTLAELTDAVWPDGEGISGSTVRAWLRNLRLKLADIGQQDYLKTEPGYTYKLDGHS